jgi:DNA-binding CsgD family transcriptional regulator
MAVGATLVGRRSELEAIELVIEAACEGRSGGLVVRGVAGVGKTALLDAAIAGAPDLRVLRAEGVQAEAELAFAGLHQLLRPLTGLLERLPARQREALEAAFGLTGGEVGDRFLVAAGALGLLAEAAEEQPLLCVVDDLQWIDRPSADALVFVARRLDAEPVALLIAMRDTALVPDGLRRFDVLELGGLTRADAREILEQTGRLAPADRERVLDAAEGIPLALLELPRGSAPASMGAVEQAFAERIAALPERSRRAVLLAAADDDPAGATALRVLAAAEDPPGWTGTEDPARSRHPQATRVEDLAAAEEAGLLRLTAEGVAFRHPLVRSAAYGLAPFAERRQAHAALAEALTGQADADRRAWHRAAAAAGPDEEVAAELARSAERARARGGHAAAGAALERAARLTGDEALRARRLVQAAEAARLAGDLGRAGELATEVLTLRSALGHAATPTDEPLAPRGDLDRAPPLAGDAATVAAASAIRGIVRAHRGDSEGGEADLAAAARALAAHDPGRALRTALLAAETAALAGRHDRAAELARWAAELPTGDSDAGRAVVVFAGGISDMFGGRLGEAGARFRAALELAERAGDPQLLTWAGVGVVYAGDLAGGRHAMARSLAAARERGDVAGVVFALQVIAHTELLEGRLAVAGTDAAEGLALAQASGDELGAAHFRGLLAWHAAIRGDAEGCRAFAAETLEGSAEQPMRVAGESARRGLALLDLGAGNHEAAFDRLAAIVGAPRAHPARRFQAVGDLVEAAAGCDRGEEVREALGTLAAWGEANDSAWAAATVAGADVQLAPDATTAQAAFARALAAHADVELPFERARLELRLGEHLRRAKRRIDARRHLRAALDGFAQLGAAPWEQRAAAELRATGETARKRDASTIDELTPQELQIARMVAEGATNREIAGRLFLSPRTVDYHLRKVFQKLELTSRTQLAALEW